MNKQHPYPQHIVEAIKEKIAQDHGDLLVCTRVASAWGYGTMSQDDFIEIGDDPDVLQDLAEAALTALWDASRVDHPGQIEPIPGDTILTTPDNRAVSAQTMQWVVRPADYPAHVIFWGDHNDR